MASGKCYLRSREVFQPLLNFWDKRSLGLLSVLAQYCLAPSLIANGQMQQGKKLMDKAQKILIRNQRRTQYAISEYIVGEVNSQIATGPKPSLSIMAKNIGFLVKNVPFAAKKAEEHFEKAIEKCKEIGVKGYLGQTYLSLGLLYKATKRTDQAKGCLLKAVDLFQECEAGEWLKQANEALGTLE